MMRYIPLRLLQADIRFLIKMTLREPINARQQARIIRSLRTLNTIKKIDGSIRVIGLDDDKQH
jgi:hypothetical protein